MYLEVKSINLSSVFEIQIGIFLWWTEFSTSIIVWIYYNLNFHSCSYMHAIDMHIPNMFRFYKILVQRYSFLTNFLQWKYDENMKKSWFFVLADFLRMRGQLVNVETVYVYYLEKREWKISLQNQKLQICDIYRCTAGGSICVPFKFFSNLELFYD